MYGFYGQALQNPFIQTESTLKSPLFTRLDLYVFNEPVLHPPLSAFLRNSVQFAKTNLFPTALNGRWRKQHTSTRTRSFVNHVRKTRSATRRYTNHFLILQDSLNAVLLAINPGVLSFPLHCLRYQSASQNQTQAGNWTNYSADGKKTKNIQLCKSEVKAAPAIRPHQNDFSSPSSEKSSPVYSGMLVDVQRYRSGEGFWAALVCPSSSYKTARIAAWR